MALHADHLAAADDDRAAAAYIDAARAEQAALRFERALGAGEQGKRARTRTHPAAQEQLLLGELLLQLGRTHDALTAYREALDFAIDQNGHGRAWFGIASALRIMDRHEEALEALEHAESALGDAADLRRRAPALHVARQPVLSRSDESMPACRRTSRRTASRSQAQSHVEIARALGGLGDAYYQRGTMVHRPPALRPLHRGGAGPRPRRACCCESADARDHAHLLRRCRRESRELP